MKVLFCVLMLSLQALDSAFSQGYPMQLPLLQDNHLFVVTIVGIENSPWKEETSRSEARTLNVTLRLDKNIRGELDLKEGATAVVVLKQVRFPGFVGDNPEFWSYYNLTSGESWMIGQDNAATDLQTLLQHPKLGEMVSSPVTVEDVQFMAQNLGLPIAEQPQKLAEWLDQTKEARGYHIGEYAAELLTNSAVSNKVSLETMAETGVLEKRLTEDGQYAFLIHLYQAELDKWAVFSDSTKQILTRDTIEFLFANNHSPEGKLQGNIVQNYLPRLLASPQAEPMLHKAMNETERGQVMAQLEHLSSSNKLSSADHQSLARLYELLSNISSKQ